MKVISSELGFVLVFNSLNDLSGVVGHLQGFSEYIKKENVKPPFLYGVFDSRIPENESRDVIHTLKLHLQPLGENENVKALEFEMAKIKNLTRSLLNDIYEFGEPKGGKTVQALHDMVFEEGD